MRERKPYRIIGAYDSETTNIDTFGRMSAYPILHQVGLLSCDLEDVEPGNVEDVCTVRLFRHSIELYEFLDGLVSDNQSFVPVLCCHNLSFDMYGLAPWLSRQDVRVLAKSPRKPISFTIRDEGGNPALVIWDTAIFSQQSLERMGEDAGYSKGVGEWDYSLIRTPETPLTAPEIDYAKRDIYALMVWLSWWSRRNPDIDLERLGLNVVTKTGVVRERRRVRFFKLRAPNYKYSIGKLWLYRCRTEAPKSDDELYTMLAATRGGFTFCSMANASRVFDFADDRRVFGYDATSMHPSQMVSHVYPTGFHEAPEKVLSLAFEVVGLTTFEDLLKDWEKPFSCAFYACYEFENLLPKPGSLFEEFGIFPLASARYVRADDDNGDRENYADAMRDYRDAGTAVKSAFGKVISAGKIRLYLTELSAWELHQAYTWDDVRPIHGYYTGRFTRPSDYDTVSVMQFYKAKDAFKEARETFYSAGTIHNKKELIELGIPPTIAQAMEDGTLPSGEVEASYLSLKADLNALFGINASNEYRRDTVLTEGGIAYDGPFGLANKPKNSKVWYQFGQRIVGWSRIAQIVAMHLVRPYIDTIVNGDTDSIKFVMRTCDKAKADKALARYAQAVDKAKRKVCARVKRLFPKQYSDLEQIGYYVEEFAVKRFCASWNKAYCTHDERKGFSFTLAGIPTRRRENRLSCFIGIDGFANRLLVLGWSYEQVCNVFLGYNVTYSHELIRLNGRTFPDWGETVFERVTDYRGESALVAEPKALALHPMSKTVNDTDSLDNMVNMSYALRNNPNVNTAPVMLYAGGLLDMEGLLDG